MPLELIDAEAGEVVTIDSEALINTEVTVAVAEEITVEAAAVVKEGMKEVAIWSLLAVKLLERVATVFKETAVVVTEKFMELKMDGSALVVD